jgi:hypothetical protein
MVTRVILGAVIFFALMIGLSFGLGWINVGYTNTVGKAQQNAERHVFEQTQSYVEGKRQELVKYHHEWMTANKDDKEAIEAVVRQSFANFDKNKIEDAELYTFLQNCMNK